MKKNMTQLKSVVFALLIIIGLSAKAATYTAVANGNWSAAATWGGTAPGNTISGADIIVIPASITVNLDQDVTINNLLASIAVTGTLSGNHDLTITSGDISQTGSVTVNTLTIGALGTITSTGTITADNFVNNQTLLGLTSQVIVNGMLTLNSGLLQLNTGSLLTVGNNATVNIAGGGWAINGGSLAASGNFNLMYSGTATTIGPEAALSGVQNITLNLSSASSQISAQSNIAAAGSLNLQQGTLQLNGYDLTINGTVSSAVAGTISSTSSSNITINGSGTVGNIRFNSSNNTVGNLTVNIGSSGMVTLNSDLHVSGNLNVTGGSLSVGVNGHLFIDGTMAFNGTGTLATSTASSISVNGSGNQGTLVVSGSSMGDLSVNIGSGGSVSLGSDLTIDGALSISNGTLSLSGHNLTINGMVAVSGGGSIGGSVNSNITVNGTGSVGSLGFSGSAHTVHDLTLNIGGSGGSVAVNTDLTITGTLHLQAGNLALSSHNLTVSGSFDASGTGTISGTGNTDITLNGSGNMGTIEFASSGAMVGDLNIDVSGGSGSISLGSDLTIGGTLYLTGGQLALNGNDLTINGNIDAGGAGTIAGNAQSNITINGSGSAGTIELSDTASTINSLTVNVGGGNGNVSLGGDATINGTLTLTSGTLSLNGNSLTLHGTADASGSGSIMVDNNGSLTLSGSGNMGTLSFSGTSLGSLTINTSGSGGSMSLASDLTVNGTLALTSGNLVVGSHNLTVASAGSVQGGGSSSYIVTNAGGMLTMNVANAGANATFHVGSQSNYAPITITNHSTAAGNFMVNAHSGVMAHGTTGSDISTTESVVNTAWDIETDITSGVNADIKAAWSANMEVNGFNRNQAYLSHYVNGSWDTHATGQATAEGNLYTVTRTGVTSFSPFAVFDSNTETGINDIAAETTLQYFPNPATNQLNLIMADYTVAKRYRIYDITGALLLENAITDKTTNIDVSSLSNGVYTVSLSNGQAFRFTRQ